MYINSKYITLLLNENLFLKQNGLLKKLYKQNVVAPQAVRKRNWELSEFVMLLPPAARWPYKQTKQVR